MLNENAVVYQVLVEMESVYRACGQDWRSRAFGNAASTVKLLETPLSSYKRLTDIKGIGKGIEQVIKEVLETGSCDRIKRISKEVDGIQQLQLLAGIGPATAKRLQARGIQDLADLREELEANKGVLNTDERQAFGLALHDYETTHVRVPWGIMTRAIQPRMLEIRSWKEVVRADVAGSLRRGRESVKDVDIVIALKEGDRGAVAKKLGGLFSKLGGEKKLQGKFHVYEGDRNADILFVDPSEYGSAMNHFTGSKDWNIAVRGHAKTLGAMVNQYGVFRGDERIGGEKEEDMFHLLDIPWVPPEHREAGMLNRALANRTRLFFDDLVEMSDVVGDLHCHTVWSDGLHTIEQMVERAEDMGLKFLGISDHSHSLTIANGLTVERLLEQNARIREIDERCKLKLLSGSEMDIQVDGSFDWSDEILDQLDYVVAALHIKPGTNTEQRMTAAMVHPKVVSIAHPTGRMFGKRTVPQVNWRSIFAKAKKSGTAIEINGQPERADLPENLIELGMMSGIQFILTGDSHGGFEALPFAVKLARRGGVKWDNVFDFSMFEPEEMRMAANRRIQ